MLYRAEVNGKGLFHILNQLEEVMEEEAPLSERIALFDAEEALESNLPCPTIPSGLVTESWFTELGFRKARPHLDTIGGYAEEYIPDAVYEVREEKKTGEFFHLDKFQVIFKKEGMA